MASVAEGKYIASAAETCAKDGIVVGATVETLKKCR